jgi:hypothetical protein
MSGEAGTAAGEGMPKAHGEGTWGRYMGKVHGMVSIILSGRNPSQAQFRPSTAPNAANSRPDKMKWGATLAIGKE